MASKETRLARLRPRLTRVAWPTVALFAVSAGLCFLGGRELDASTALAVQLIAGLLLFLLWLLPMLSYLGTFVDVTTLSVRARRGILGLKSREVSISAITEVVYSRRLGVVLKVRDQEDFALKGLSKPKAVAEELSRLAK
ncbi:MAG: hypothetical protein RLZ71_250 [Actinomycetota bacterium]|jgi:hypothetical protein